MGLLWAQTALEEVTRFVSLIRRPPNHLPAKLQLILQNPAQTPLPPGSPLRSPKEILLCIGPPSSSLLHRQIPFRTLSEVKAGPMDYTVHRILQARILEWAAFPSPGDLPSPRTEPPTLQADSSPAEPQGSPRILEQVAYPFPSRSSRPRHQTRVSRTAGGFFTNWAN